MTSEETYTDVLDPITFSVILSRFDAIVNEMTRVLERSAWTSILALAHDYSCGIYDAVPRQVSMYDALPIHTTSLHLVVKEIADAFAGSINEGDVFLCNDPYVGAPHQPDTCVYAPLFVDGSVFGWVANSMHLADVGGFESIPGEGVRGSVAGRRVEVGSARFLARQGVDTAALAALPTARISVTSSYGTLSPKRTQSSRTP